jgi:hypothetical protein
MTTENDNGSPEFTATTAPGDLPEGWKKLAEDDQPDAARLLDVILLNGVCLMDRDYAKIDWTQVRDWRYAAPSTSPVGAKEKEL